MVPSEKEITEFQVKLNQTGLEKVSQNLRHHTYGAKDNWQFKEAQAFVDKHKETIHTDLKKESIKQAEESIRLQKQVNKTAKWALFISFLALVVSILVAFLK